MCHFDDLWPPGAEEIAITRKKTKKTTDLECVGQRWKPEILNPIEPVVEFSSSQSNLSYISGCPTSCLDLHLVANVAAQNYNPFCWTVLSSYQNSLAVEDFLKNNGGEYFFWKLAWVTLSKTFLINAYNQWLLGGALRNKLECGEEVGPAKLCISV